MKVLLVYPEFPDTFWGFKRALWFIGKRAFQPPLGLLTVAAMLPAGWNLELVDLNIEKLDPRRLEEADLVMVSAMSIQSRSALEIAGKCRDAGVTTVGGGPLFSGGTGFHVHFDHVVVGEAENALPDFLRDFRQGKAKHIYEADEYADLSLSPAPRWDLLKIGKYASLGVQMSRGCPYDCDFCCVSALYGKKVRTKPAKSVVAELEAIYATGWRGPVFFVDDNFVGPRRNVKSAILPEIINWSIKYKRPFTFMTQVSIDVSDDDALLDAMAEAGFDTVFIGIETTNEESLLECGKRQNLKRDLLDSVKRIQKAGMQVLGGFIIGFDSDTQSVFKYMPDFIKNSRIVSAMIGLLNAPGGTKLYERMKREGRLIGDVSGSNTDFSMNFTPAMDLNTLIEGYRNVISNVYSPRAYYERVREFLSEYRPRTGRIRMSFSNLAAFFRATLKIGILGKERRHFWSLLIWTLSKRPSMLPYAVTFAVYGFHYRCHFGL